MSGEEELFPFWHRERIRFRDVDLQGIVYYGKYLDFFDNALYEYLRSLGFEAGQLDAQHGFDTAVVRSEIDYLSSARFDEMIDIGVKVTRLGTSSFDASFEIRNGSEVVCRSKLVMVNYDAKVARARPIPDAIRDAIKHTSRSTVDRADTDRSEKQGLGR